LPDRLILDEIRSNLARDLSDNKGLSTYFFLKFYGYGTIFTDRSKFKTILICYNSFEIASNIRRHRARLFFKYIPYDSYHTTHLTDAHQYDITAIWEAKTGPDSQLPIYFELGLYRQSGQVDGYEFGQFRDVQPSIFRIWIGYCPDGDLCLHVSEK